MRRITSFLFLTWLPVALAVQASDANGLESLRKNAESGDVDAMLEVGILYEFGFRMSDNKAPALAWYKMAAENGNPKADARQNALRATMSEKEVSEAERLYAEYSNTVRKAPKKPQGEAVYKNTTPEPMSTPAVPTSPTGSSVDKGLSLDAQETKLKEQQTISEPTPSTAPATATEPPKQP